MDNNTDLQARAAANVALARERAGLSDPVKARAYHAALQLHLPRMLGWINDVHRRAMWAGDRAEQIAALQRESER